jgi:hypothetical protein
MVYISTSLLIPHESMFSRAEPVLSFFSLTTRKEYGEEVGG